MLSAKGGLQKVIALLRAEQRSDGAWAGELRSGMIASYYAASLALAGEPPDSEVIRDLCDFAEECVTPDGGVAMYPGEPSDRTSSWGASLLLGWARPGSPALASVREYLRGAGGPPNIPLFDVSRFAFDPASRAEILARRGPRSSLRRFAQVTWPRAFSLPMFSHRRMFAQPIRPPSPALEALVGPMMEWMFWPDHRKALELPQALAPWMTLGILAPYVALQRLAGRSSPDLERLNDFTLRYMADHQYEDGSVLYINFLPSYLLCAQTFDRQEDRRLIESGLRSIGYRRGGWLRGSTIAINVLDTAMTVLAMRAAGVPEGDPALTSAAGFLRSSQSAEGMWSWSYAPAMGRRFRPGDTDDTGGACLALMSLGEASTTAAIRDGTNACMRLQDRSGAMNTFSIGGAANTMTVSNTSRAVQAVAAAYDTSHPAVRRGCEWLLSQQESNGSWLDFWIARWIYGTVMALEALVRLGYAPPGSAAAERAVSWLLRRQNGDGGWGEDWRGTRGGSTAEHTAMAVYGLCLGARPDARPAAAMQAGIRWLLDHQRTDGGWDPAYVGAYSHMDGYASTQVPLYWAALAMAEYERTIAQPEARVALHTIGRRRAAKAAAE